LADAQHELGLQQLEAEIGHSFRDRKLLRCALTHPTATSSTDTRKTYQVCDIAIGVLRFMIA
jgi:dsRNA-specific ribonuclease